MADKCIISFANSTERRSYTLATFLTYLARPCTHNTHHYLFNFILSLCTSRHSVSAAVELVGCGWSFACACFLRLPYSFAHFKLLEPLLFIRTCLAPRRVICICLICMLMFCSLALSLSSSPLRIGFGFIALIDSINPARFYLEHKIYMGYKCVWGHPGPGVKIARVEFHLGQIEWRFFFCSHLLASNRFTTH